MSYLPMPPARLLTENNLGLNSILDHVESLQTTTAACLLTKSQKVFSENDPQWKLLTKLTNEEPHSYPVGLLILFN